MSQTTNRPTLRDDELDPDLAEVSRLVIGCAIDIHKALGPGFSKEVYENALAYELRQEEVDHTLRWTFDVHYDGENIGQHVVSLYVDNRFVVDVIDSMGEISGFDRSAMRARLRAADIGLGLMINFNRPRLKDGGLVRVLNPDKIDAIKGDGSAHMDDSDDHDEDDD
ncbi:MAG: GxxExxY protein [Planctomycetota bacterium]